MNNSQENKTKQEQRERRKNNRFYERLAVVLVFILLVFTGVSMFVTPKEKIEFKFDKLNISEDIKHEEKVEINEEPIKAEEYSYEEPQTTISENVNEELDEVIKPKKPVSNYTPAERQRLVQMRKKNMQDIFDKKFTLHQKPKPKRQTLASKNYNKYYSPQQVYPNNIPPAETPSYQETPKYEEQAPFYGSGNYDNYFDILLKDSTCTPEEIEYVLKLYTSKYSNPLTLVFRRNGHEKGVPEIIYATLPNNQWKDIGDSLGNVMQTLFEGLMGENNPAANNMKKVTAMITTECSETQYVSQSFYVSNSAPAMTSLSNAQSFCSSRHGRLPDILELISIVTHKSMPSGYYITNSERLSTDRFGEQVHPLGDYMVLELRGNDIYFTYSSKIPTQSVYAECVLR